jgi:hypothetical protein
LTVVQGTLNHLTYWQVSIELKRMSIGKFKTTRRLAIHMGADI